MSKNKTLAIAIALFLMFAMAFSLVALPNANAHTPPWTVSTYAYLVVSPSPVGVGQTAYVNFWIDKVPPTAEGPWGSRWHDMKVTVTKPNGATDDLGTFNSDATGGAWTQYVPDQTGEYTFTFNFPTQVAKDENPFPYYSSYLERTKSSINDTYTASSATTTLTVQEQQVETVYPDNPLPTEYWQRPMNSMNREWYSIGGNWLGLGGASFLGSGMYDAQGNYNPYTTAPNSAHVLWTQPIAFGGQIGGEFGSSGTGVYATGTAYETKFAPVILYGILYYTDYPGASNNMGPLTAVNLRTGKTLWTVNASNPLWFGMVYDFVTGDQYGAHVYLFTAPPPRGFGNAILGSTPNLWSMYDAMTGQWILNIANPQPGMFVEGPNGELLSYRVSGGQLSLWNVSKCIAVASQEINQYRLYSSIEIWRPPQGATINWTDGYEWSVPIATDISGVPITPGLSLSKISDDVILMTAQSTSTSGSYSETGWRVDAGYSATDGHLLWGPINRTITQWIQHALGPASEGIYTVYDNQLLKWTAYSIKTGEKLWTTEPENSSWDYFGAHAVIGYDNFYSWGMGGEVYAYNVTTGALDWSWNAGSSGVDSPYGVWPLGTFGDSYILADGKLYVRAGHDYTPPMFEGAKLYCINATSGEEIWSSLSFNIAGSPAVADGIMVWDNGYDNQIYAYGRGQSATTVSAPDTVQPLGTQVLVQGTVTDQSPGQTCLGIPAAGTPAISDESMSAWMEYLYQQQSKPANATGVKVTISVLDPNNNVYDVGTTTSDASGNYKLMFTPQVPGAYTIIASFAGSESYYSSSAETNIGVNEAPVATAPPTPPPASLADIYFLPMSIVILIVVILAAIAIVLMLRKR